MPQYIEWASSSHLLLRKTLFVRFIYPTPCIPHRDFDPSKSYPFGSEVSVSKKGSRWNQKAYSCVHGLEGGYGIEDIVISSSHWSVLRENYVFFKGNYGYYSFIQRHIPKLYPEVGNYKTKIAYVKRTERGTTVKENFVINHFCLIRTKYLYDIDIKQGVLAYLFLQI